MTQIGFEIEQYVFNHFADELLAAGEAWRECLADQHALNLQALLDGEIALATYAYYRQTIKLVGGLLTLQELQTTQ